MTSESFHGYSLEFASEAARTAYHRHPRDLEILTKIAIEHFILKGLSADRVGRSCRSVPLAVHWTTLTGTRTNYECVWKPHKCSIRIFEPDTLQRLLCEVEAVCDWLFRLRTLKVWYELELSASRVWTVEVDDELNIRKEILVKLS